MEAPCIRVPREDGERVRRQLAEDDRIDQRYRIDAEDGFIYIPISTTKDLTTEFDVVVRDVEPREQQTLPRDLLEEAPSYERLGDIALIDEDDPERAQRLATALMDSSLPIKTVLNRASEIKGEQRVRDWEVLAGIETETVHQEFGAEFLVDVTDVYFSPRLATERHRVVSQVQADEHVFDLFAGVGPFIVPCAMAGAHGVGVDINPVAVRYLRENARRNGVEDRVTAIEGDVRAVGDAYVDWGDRLIMNLPHSADAFLETARKIAGDRCILHYYDIQPEADPFSPGERAVRNVMEESYEVTVLERRQVRSYSPQDVNVCLDIQLTAQ